MRHVLWAGMALMTALGLQVPSANAQLNHSYSTTLQTIDPGAAGTNFFGMVVNHNVGSPSYGLLYVCETAPIKQIRIYGYDDAARQWTRTPMSVSIATADGLPYDVALGSDDSVWVLSSTGLILSASHPTASAAISVASRRVTGVNTTSRGLAVAGDINNAKAYVKYGSIEGWNITGTTSSSLFSPIVVGSSVNGITMDATGAVAVPMPVAAGMIRRYDPVTGALLGSIAPLPPNADILNLSLLTGDFVPDASYPGGGFFVVFSRIGAAPHNVRVLRFDGTGAFLDGFGPEDDITGAYSTVTVPYRNSASAGAYGTVDTRGNMVMLSKNPAGTYDRIVYVRSDGNGPKGNPWGDVNADGKVTNADALMVEAYIADASQFTSAQQDRIQRYGDVNGTVNQNSIGNDTVNAQDTMRMALLAGGIIDPGTAGPAPALYGDINGDGKVDLLDAVATQRGANGLGDAATLATVNTRGRGDISPTVSSISFGDKSITQADADVIRSRAFGTEANAPAYTDMWPLRAPNCAYPSQSADLYSFTDVTGRSGDLNHQIFYQTQSPKEVNGLTISEIMGTDGSLIGVYKGADGTVYAKYLKYPYAFGSRLITFDSAIKVLDMNALGTLGATWSGKTTTQSDDMGFRPVTYKGTLLANEDVYTLASGSFTGATDTPKSTWSQTARLRLDVAILAGPISTVEMQQAFFYDLMPFIGMVNRGQASHMGSPAPMTDRPLLRLDEVEARGVTYNQMVP